MLSHLAHRSRLSGLPERRLRPYGGGHQLEWMQMRTRRPRGTVFAPPLVGGDGLLVLRHLRPLRSKGYNLLSFNYSGHGLSSRPFSIRQSFRDTRCLLAFVRRHPMRFAEPHYGVGICYAAIPLVNALHRFGEPLARIVLINAIPRLFSRNLLHSFWDFRRDLGTEAWPAANLATQMHRYAEFLLPGITINRRQFGLLALRRMRMLQTLVDWLASRQLRAVRLAKTSVLCLYSSDDRLFRAFRYFDAPRDYEAALRQVCPTAEFIRLEGDHFLSNRLDRQHALTAVTAFLNANHRRRYA
ncbi:MAG: alpha/beta fold hydrolase [Desulfobacterales bacterium]|nr:alpha/beta fold hydrolase [Desulfobacterales bacterium]